MKIDIEGKPYRIYFKHSPNHELSKRWTYCYIDELVPDSGTPPVKKKGITAAISVCTFPDMFSKAEGRKRSLARAITNWKNCSTAFHPSPMVSKENREKIWKTYLSLHNVPGVHQQSKKVKNA